MLSSVTNPRTPHPEPVRAGAATPASNALAASVRTTRVVAIAAIVLALVALGLAAWRVLLPADTGGACQTRAWDVTPATADLPADWSVSASQYDIMRKTMSFVGPVPTDQTSAQAVIYATVSCYQQGAADGVTRSRKAAEDAGQAVSARDDLGDQAYSAVDGSGAGFLQLRHGDIVVYLAASGDASATELDELASVFDKALGGDGGTIAAATVAPSGDASADPGTGSLDPGESVAAESPAAPELLAKLPAKVGDVTLSSDSASGSTILSDDQGSRAILAALRAAGKAADDLSVAQAFDAAGVSDLAIMAVTVAGMPVAQTKQLVLDSWLAATGTGVTSTPVTLAGKSFTRIDYGDGGTMDYVLVDGNNVIVITTADPKVAEQAAAALP
jgi:hypothetical protein